MASVDTEKMLIQQLSYNIVNSLGPPINEGRNIYLHMYNTHLCTCIFNTDMKMIA